MRVLLLNYEYPPVGGGAGVAAEALAHGLVRRGVSVDVVTTGSAAACGRADGASRPAGGPTIRRVPVTRQGIHDAGLPSIVAYLTGALPIVRRLCRHRPFDVVHFFFSLPTGALLPLLRLDETPVVVSLRGSDVPGYDRSRPLLHVLHHGLRPFTRWVWRRADRVVALSAALGRLACETMPDLRYRVIRNGVDTRRFRPASRAWRTARPVRCIAVARLVDRKGVDDLLRAWVHLERGRHRLDVVGDGPASPYLRALSARLGLDGEVTFVGALDHAAVARRMRTADIFTLSPRSEAFGNVFAEALASGLPVVATAVGGIPEFVEDGVHGILVEPGDRSALAGAIQRLAWDVDTRCRMGVNARAHATAKLSWDSVTSAYLDLYAGLGAEVRAGPDEPEPAVPRPIRTP